MRNMSVKNKTYLSYIIYFLSLGVLVSGLRGSLCWTGTRGMDMSSFLLFQWLIIAVCTFITCDLVLHKLRFRIISLITIWGFMAWSYMYFFRMEALKESYTGEGPPFNLLAPPSTEDFIFIWFVCQGIIFYLFLAVGVSYLLRRKKLLMKRDNA